MCVLCVLCFYVCVWETCTCVGCVQVCAVQWGLPIHLMFFLTWCNFVIFYIHFHDNCFPFFINLKGYKRSMMSRDQRCAMYCCYVRNKNHKNAYLESNQQMAAYRIRRLLIVAKKTWSPNARGSCRKRKLTLVFPYSEKKNKPINLMILYTGK